MKLFVTIKFAVMKTKTQKNKSCLKPVSEKIATTFLFVSFCPSAGGVITAIPTDLDFIMEKVSPSGWCNFDARSAVEFTILEKKMLYFKF